MFKKVKFVVLVAALMSSCASKVHRGVVAMKIDESTAHVGLMRNEVAVGDHVELYTNHCINNRAANQQECEKVSRGHGTVTQLLNENYTLVKFDDGVTFREGDYVEKHTH